MEGNEERIRSVLAAQPPHLVERRRAHSVGPLLPSRTSNVNQPCSHSLHRKSFSSTYGSIRCRSYLFSLLHLLRSRRPLTFLNSHCRFSPLAVFTKEPTWDCSRPSSKSTSDSLVLLEEGELASTSSPIASDELTSDSFPSLRVPSGKEKTLLMFVIRDHVGSTPMSNLESTLTQDMEKIWYSLAKVRFRPSSLPLLLVLSSSR